MNIRDFIFVGSLIILLLGGFFGQVVLATEFVGGNYKVLDPVLVPANFATSSGFQLWSTLSQIAIGTSTSASFNLNCGLIRTTLSFPAWSMALM